MKKMFFISLLFFFSVTFFLNNQAFAIGRTPQDESNAWHECYGVAWMGNVAYMRYEGGGNSPSNPIVFKLNEGSSGSDFRFNVYSLTSVCGLATQSFTGNISNVKVTRIGGIDSGYITEGRAGYGQGYKFIRDYHPGQGLVESGSFSVRVKKEALYRLPRNEPINLPVSVVTCTQMSMFYPGDWRANIDAGRERDSLMGIPDDYGLRTCTEKTYNMYVKIIVPNRFNVEGETKAAVLDSQQQLNYNSSRFQKNNRNNPQIAKVGQWVSFAHNARVKNFNKAEVVRGIGSFTTTRDYDGTVNSNKRFTWLKQQNLRESDVIRQGYISNGLNSVGESRETFKITRNMAGRIICSRMNYTIDGKDGEDSVIKDRDGRANYFNKTTNEACVYVPYNFDITPCVQIDKIRNCSGGDLDIPVDGNIPNQPNDGEIIRIPDNDTVTSNVKYKVTTWRVSADKEKFQTKNNKRDNENSDTCAASNFYYQDYQGIENCRVVREGSGKYNEETRVADFIPSIEDGVEPGTRYCVALSISPYKMDSSQSKSEQEDEEKHSKKWRHSAPICIKLIKKPKVQFWGNGVYSKSGIRTSLSATNHGTLGSWVEYEALSAVKIKDFRTESSQSTRKLAIEDYVSQSSFGQGKSSIESLISNISSKFPKRSSDTPNVKVEVYNDTNTTLKSLQADRQTRVIYGKNIRISGDIVNADRAVNSDADFRQIIIIADGNIVIDQGVTRIDAWLISRENINTCAFNGVQNTNEVNTKNCNNQLKIRSGTVSNGLRLWRTAGSDGKTKEQLTSPAEIFNQSADTYLWAQTQSGGEGKIVTTYTKELPVRY